MRSFLRLSAVSLLILSTGITLSAQQQQVSPELLSQIQSQYPNLDYSQLSRFAHAGNGQLPDSSQLRAMVSRKPSTGTADDSTADTLSDSNKVLLKKALPKNQDSIEQEQNRSAYDRIFKGENVNPDSMLSKITMFGYDVFAKLKPSTFSPSDYTSVPQDYPVNVGDEINVTLWGRINEQYRLSVSREGAIAIPQIGPVLVGGLPFETVQKNILDRVRPIEGVQASVSMGELRSIGVFIVGEVKSPGLYTVSSLSNVTNALFAAGGPTQRGSLRNVQLKRNGQLIATIDFYDFLLSGSDRTGLRLQSGDVILVPIVKSMAAVVGNVRRSAFYELKGKSLLNDVLNLAGGISPAGWINRIQVERFEHNDYRVVLDLGSGTKDLPSFEVEDGDIVKVFPILVKDKNAVYLDGNVLRPGKYEFREGMKVADVLPDFESLLPESYFDYAVILRKEPPSFLERIVAFNLKNAIANASSSDNLALEPQDKIVVYNKDYFEPDRSVIIDGAVTVPGKYKLLDNMKVRDLILQAGGLSEDASPTRGEVYRRKSVNEQVTTEKYDFCVDCAMQDDQQQNLILQRSDRVFIRSKKGWEEERKVTLSGQFMYPGTYVIFEGEALGDLIRRAGGFKEDAYLAAANFTRLSVKTLEERRMADYNRQLETDILKLSTELATEQQSDIAQALAQQTALIDKLNSVKAIGRVVIDLTKQKTFENFALEDGDELYVPRNLNTVSVLGEIYNPSTFKYTAGSNVSDYIEAAGGLKEETSDRKHIYIIKANGSIITNKMTRIETAPLAPGDAVMVPQKILYTNPHKVFVDSVDAIFKIATFLGTVVTLVTALIALQQTKG